MLNIEKFRNNFKITIQGGLKTVHEWSECAYFIKGIMAGIEINDEKSYVYFLTKRVR